MAKGRIGRKSAEDSDKQKGLCIDTDKRASGKEFRQEADTEATKDIHSQCAKRECDTLAEQFAQNR